jgi:hypothetical protein
MSNSIFFFLVVIIIQVFVIKMTLRKCIFDTEYYSERGLRNSGPPLKLSTSPGIYTSGAYTSQPE